MTVLNKQEKKRSEARAAWKAAESAHDSSQFELYNEYTSAQNEESNATSDKLAVLSSSIDLLHEISSSIASLSSDFTKISKSPDSSDFRQKVYPYLSSEDKQKFDDERQNAATAGENIKNLQRKISNYQRRVVNRLRHKRDLTQGELDQAKQDLNLAKSQLEKLQQQLVALPKIVRVEKTITRTINVTNPDGKVSSKKQTATIFGKKTTLNGHNTYSWNTTGNWDRFIIPELKGFTPKVQGSVDQTSVGDSTPDATVNITYQGSTSTSGSSTGSAHPSTSDSSTSAAHPSTSDGSTSAAHPSTSDSSTSAAHPSTSDSSTSAAHPSTSDGSTSVTQPSMSDSTPSSANSNTSDTPSGTNQSNTNDATSNAAQPNDNQVSIGTKHPSTTENGLATVGNQFGATGSVKGNKAAQIKWPVTGANSVTNANGVTNLAGRNGNTSVTNQKNKRLPQTGNQSAAYIALGAMSAMFGVVLLGKKRDY